MKVLIAGPCISEFGWEVCEYVGYIMRRADEFDKVVVCSRAERKPLYEPLGDKLIFVPHTIRATVTDHRAHRVHNQEVADKFTAELKSFDGAGVEYFNPPHPNTRFREQFTDHGLQAMPRYGRRMPRIIVHMRNKAYIENSEPNYPAELWMEIVDALSGYGRIAAIGTVDEAMCFEGMEDFRGIPMAQLFDVLANADICVGPSSGPIHLASMCGCPHVTWTNKLTTRLRYEGGWNPHGTRCVAYWHDKAETISPQLVIAGINEIMAPPTDERGIVYVCAGEDWPAILETSLKTLRQFYSGNVAILVPRLSDAVAEMADKYRARVVNCNAPETATPQTQSRWIKTQLDRFSPYRLTLYLDCDTFILNSIDDVWRVLPEDLDVAMKPETACPTVGSRDYRNNPPEAAETIGLCGASGTHWHSSTILFRRDMSDTRHLFAHWHREWAKHGLNPKRRRIQDQPALARAAHVTGVPIHLLPVKYNARHDDKGGDRLEADTVVYSLSTYSGTWQAKAQEVLELTRCHKTGLPEAKKPENPRKFRRMGDR